MTLPTTNPMCYSSRVSNTAVHTGLAEIFPRSPLASVPLCIGCSNIGCQEQRVQFQRITKSTYCRKSHRFLSQDTVTHVLFILTLFHLLIRFAGTCCLIWFRLPEQYKTCPLVRFLFMLKTYFTADVLSVLKCNAKTLRKRVHM